MEQSAAEKSEERRSLPETSGQSLPRSLMVFALTSLILLGAISSFPKCGLWEVKDRESEFIGARHLAYALFNVPGSAEGGPMRASAKSLEDVFSQRLEQYQKHCESLSKNLLYQAIFVCLSLLVVLIPQKTYTIPVLDIEVERRVALSLVPAGLVILWSQFGFLLSESVDLRMGLWKIAEAVEITPNAMATQPVTSLTGATDIVGKAWIDLPQSVTSVTTNDWRVATYTYGHKRVLHDGGLLDGWFDCFRIHYTLRAKSRGVLFIHVLLLGVFCGLANACVLASIWERGKYATDPGARVLHEVFFLGVTIYLILTHWGFIWAGGHPNWMQPLSLFVCAGLLLILVAGRSILKIILKRRN